MGDSAQNKQWRTLLRSSDFDIVGGPDHAYEDSYR